MEWKPRKKSEDYLSKKRAFSEQSLKQGGKHRAKGTPIRD